MAGGYHTCALTSAGGVECWGYNNYGQLGDGTTVDSFRPIGVQGLAGGAAAITAGYYDTCALMADGTVRCWGDNRFGQLGDGTTTNSPVPVTVAGLPDGIRAISAGGIATCALTRDRGVKCWGANSAGQLGDGTTVDRSAPVDVLGLSNGVSALAAGPDHTCAVTRGGGVKCWGNNGGGQLGDGSTTNASSPVNVYGLDAAVVALATGYDHTCALTSGGGVKCWGGSFHGELGDGTSGTNSTLPVDVLGLASGAVAIAVGDSANHTCALTSEGGITCWGYNAYGQLGNGSATDSGKPVDVLGLASRVDSVAVGYYHSCALMSTGAVKCWGNNFGGQLGDGTSIDRTLPVGVVFVQ